MPEEYEEETLGGDKDYIISILEEMDEELTAFDERFHLINKRKTLTHIIHTMDEMDENEVERLNSIYRYVRDAYWAGE